MKNAIKAALFGLAVGDALGVPAEFRSRRHLQQFPITAMTGYGTWNQAPGTWSDDSSLAFCLAESLTKGYDLDDIALNFVNWMKRGFWGAHHTVFDIGQATRNAINTLNSGVSPLFSGGIMEDDNGNGSLMRITPLLFHIDDLPAAARYQKVKEVSSITHGHFRSVFSCFIYLETARQLLNGKNAKDAVTAMQGIVVEFSGSQHFNAKELKLFNRVLESDLGKLDEATIHSSGYVLHTLEASLWCLLKTGSYSDAVLKAVNLGEDTDTTGCVTGGLAGLLYGYETIPKVWIEQIARRTDIDDLCERMYAKIHCG
jgi:ADP-ribosyl-[dinitrogen reductase] hydrolase